MSERAYRQRLERDLARWQADGIVPAATADAIRSRLPPMSEGVTIATVLAIVGGLLIAAAFLAFIASNWSVIARPARFAILLAGILTAYTGAAVFDRGGRPYLADLAVTVGTIVFGASIALVGQMYHLGDDFAGALALWSAGALVAAALTGSRGALAVGLVAACLWSGARVFELSDVHLPFIVPWLVAAFLAWAWHSPVARHLVALAAVVGWILCAIGVDEARAGNPAFAFCAGAALLLGAGLSLAASPTERLRDFGLTLSNYGAIALALGLAGTVGDIAGSIDRGLPAWMIALGAAGLGLAFAAASARRMGSALAAVSIATALVVVSGWAKSASADEPWLAYALALASMLSLVVSGMLDDVKPRVVAGWIGLAAVIAAVTWAVKGSLLRRAVFLAAAGIVAVGLASVLGRLVRGGTRR